MFKVRTVSLGRILTFSTAVLYLGYLWYKHKRALSHHPSDKNRPRSEPSELTKIDNRELFQALEKASRTLEVSQIVEEEPIESSVICEETMEPTVSQVKIKEIESFIDMPELYKLDTKVIAISSEQEVCFKSDIISKIESLTDDFDTLMLNREIEQDNEIENVEVIEDTINIERVKENVGEVKLCSTEKDNRTENKDHCECPKTVNVKKVKKDEEPMLFEGIKFKGKKKKNNRKKNQLSPPQDTIKIPSVSHNKDKIINSVKNVKKNHVVDEDCDSAHSVDHSVDTNDALNTVYSDIISEVSYLY